MGCRLVGSGGRLADKLHIESTGADRRSQRLGQRLLNARFPGLILLATAAMALLMLACSSVTPTPDPREPALRERAKQLYAAINEERWRAVHSFMVPEFQTICTEHEYAAIIKLGVLMFRAVSHIDGGELNFRVVDAVVDGDRGEIYAETLVDGKLQAPGVGERSEQWIFIDGQWWSHIDAEKATCSGLE